MKEFKEKISIITSLDIYTDGSCRPLLNNTYDNKGFGACGFCVVENGKIIHMDFEHTDDPVTTSQRMELEALILAAKWVEEVRAYGQQIQFFTDSAYACNGVNEWIYNWQRNGWTNSRRQPVKNLDLWSQLAYYNQFSWFKVCKVQGHSDNSWNNYIDKQVQDLTIRSKKSWKNSNIQKWDV